MAKRISGDETIHILLICLESLDLYNIDNIHQSIVKDLYKTKKTLYLCHKYSLKNHSNSSIQKTLYLLHIIGSIVLENYLQKKVATILNDYSSFYPNNTKGFSLITSQYLDRFVYRYQVFYRYNLMQKVKSTKKRKSRLHNLAIVNLYVLNKILSKYGLYMLYKYLELKIYRSTTNFC